MNNPGTSKSSSSSNKSDRIRDMLRDEGRPLTLSDLQNHIKDLSKKEMESSIKSLVDSNAVIMKTYGKQNIYFYNFQSSSDVNKLFEEAKTLEARIRKYFQKVEDKEKEIADIEIKLTKSIVVATLEELDKEFSILKESVNALHSEIDKLEDQDEPTVQVDPKELQQLKRKYDNCLEEFHKRKRMCLRVVDVVVEGYPKTKKMLMDEMQMETDEQVNFNIKDFST